MPKPHLFISYRRSDAMEAVRGLYFQLRLRFGSGEVFMDVSTIRSGDLWPDRLRAGLERASVVAVVIGPGWLKAADAYGRRRLDASGDWVRKEIEAALAGGKTVLPVLIGGEHQLPPKEALPAALRALVDHQAFVIGDAHWDDDVAALGRSLIEAHGFQPADKDVVFPQPQVTVPPLTEAELDAALARLPGWEPVESATARDYPRSRLELRRGFRFSSFRRAIAFLQTLVDPISQMKHHPRIENQWRTVFIHFTTWDIGNRISRLDVEAAELVDRLYAQAEK